MKTTPQSIRWDNGTLELLDQRQLPTSEIYLTIKDPESAAEAIKNLTVRGAPAIGITAAFGMVLAAIRKDDLYLAGAILKKSRPTAINLSWAVDEMLVIVNQKPSDLVESLEKRAVGIYLGEISMCKNIGKHGAALIQPDSGVLTHCNARGLAVTEIGTATAPLYHAHSKGVSFRVFAKETRPVLQGARLTAWELNAAGIDVTVICDSADAHLMALGHIDIAIVGADRVTANGDIVNKIGTRSLAIACAYHGIPFYVAFPSSTYDPQTAQGLDVKIEERPSSEVTTSLPFPIDVPVRNPAFDVTPNELVTGYLTEHGLFESIDEAVK